MMIDWKIILGFCIGLLVLIYGCMTGKVKEWLKYAVSVAESNLGSGTGQLKLRKVYDMFIYNFPMFSKIVPFFIFSKWVDISLEWLSYQLENNKDFAKIVKE